MIVRVPKHRTASFDVDPQRGFTPLCPDELPVQDGHKIDQNLNLQADYAELRIVSKDCHPEEAPWVAKDPSEILQPVEGNFVNLDVKWPKHCVVGTPGNDLIPGLPDESEYDFVVEKGQDPEKHPYGACYHDLLEKEPTGIIEYLRSKGIESVLVGGLATDYCVKTTALQLKQAGFRVVVNLSACRGVADETIEAAKAEMTDAGVILIDTLDQLMN